MLGNLGNLASLMKNAKEMQKNMEEAQAKLAAATIVGEAGAGAIKVTMTGSGVVKNVEISPEILSEDKVIVEDLIAAATNDATQKVDTLKRSMMEDATGGMMGNMGGIGDLLK